MEALLLGFVWYGLFPVWLFAGLGDYLCHRASRIELTSGFRESAIHLLQAIEIGIPLLAALLFEINSLVLLVMIVAVLIHDATALWDVTYTEPRRRVLPFEQHIHSYLEILPMIAVSVAALLHHEAFLAIFGAGATDADFALRWKRDPASIAQIASVLGLLFAVQGLPLAEELLRTWRQRDAADPSLGRTRSATAVVL